MGEPSQTFDSGMGQWLDWQQSPWGRLRYSLAEANLGRHLTPAPGRVLDLAGGNGTDTIRLSAKGHHATIVDYSAEMLSDARKAYTDAGMADRLTTIQADVAEFAAAADDEAFDIVLCHNLIQYTPDPAHMLALTSRLIRPGGLLSLIAINKHSEPLRKATLELDPDGALAAVDAHEAWTRTFNTSLKHYTADQAIGWLTELGHEILGHYGIRAVSDYINDNDRKRAPAFFASIEKLELSLADRMPYPLIARFFHLVSRTG